MRENKIIIPLDTQNENELNQLLEKLKDQNLMAKIGMELFYTYGPQIVTKVQDHGFKIFLDLKLHDIPNTVFKAIKTLSQLEIDILNVHCMGGKTMMREAARAFKEFHKKGHLIGVTQLTSTTQEQMNFEQKVPGKLNDSVLHLAKLAKESGLSGVVSSALEVPLIKEELGSNFKCITPGIRPKNSEVNDQKRVVTPGMAIKKGADYLVIGRPITQAKCPLSAYQKILEEIENE